MKSIRLLSGSVFPGSFPKGCWALQKFSGSVLVLRSAPSMACMAKTECWGIRVQFIFASVAGALAIIRISTPGIGGPTTATPGWIGCERNVNKMLCLCILKFVPFTQGLSTEPQKTCGNHHYCLSHSFPKSIFGEVSGGQRR